MKASLDKIDGGTKEWKGRALQKPAKYEGMGMQQTKGAGGSLETRVDTLRQ